MLNNNMEIMSYCFRYQKADEFLAQPARVTEDLMDQPCVDLLQKIGLNGFTNGHPIFVPISKFSLLMPISGLEASIPPEKITYLLSPGIVPDDVIVGRMKKLKEMGFNFAVENVVDYDSMSPFIELSDYILISFKRSEGKLEEYRRISRIYPNHQFIASDVQSPEMFESLKGSGFVCFEGKFHNMPFSQGDESTPIAPVKINRIQLVNTVREEDFSIEDVVNIVSRDPSLTISLLTMINSPYLGLSQKVTGVQQAVALLGQKEVRKWVTTAIVGLLADDRPQEITRTALLRAKFAENLAKHFEKAIHSQSLFLMGLFSLLDTMMEMTMEAALKVILVSDVIRDALINKAGDFAPVMDMVIRYEAADWYEVKRMMALSGLDASDVSGAYLEAVQWYDSIVSEAIEMESDK